MENQTWVTTDINNWSNHNHVFEFETSSMLQIENKTKRGSIKHVCACNQAIDGFRKQIQRPSLACICILACVCVRMCAPLVVDGECQFSSSWIDVLTITLCPHECSAVVRPASFYFSLKIVHHNKFSSISAQEQWHRPVGRVWKREKRNAKKRTNPKQKKKKNKNGREENEVEKKNTKYLLRLLFI